jgi:hypothetical protein
LIMLPNFLSRSLKAFKMKIHRYIILQSGSKGKIFLDWNIELAFLTMTNIRHFWVASNFHYPMQAIKTMWKAIFQNKLTIYKANLPSFVQKIIKRRCYVDLSRRLRLKCHPKMAAWERLIEVVRLFC